MILTLHRYIFRELMKVFLPAVAALTLILSLGSVLHPMQEFGVGPRQAVDMMGYFMLIMLTFILPIAALFAGALVYGRLAVDNELDACKASGISFLRLAFPGLALALIVAGANLILSFQVTPVFVHLAEKSLKADAKQIFFRNIQRRGFYELPESQYRVYADYADARSDMLAGVIVVEMKKGRIERIFTADTAKVSFRPIQGSNFETQIIAQNSSQLGPGNVGSVGQMSLAKDFGSLLGDDIKFKRIDQMREIKADLMRFDPIARLARDTYAQFITELLAQDLRGTKDEGRAYTLQGEKSSVSITFRECTLGDERTVELSGDVVVREIDNDTKQLVHTLRCKKVSLYVEANEPASILTMSIDSAREEGSGNLRMWYEIRGLLLPLTVTDTFKTADILENVRPQMLSASLKNGPNPQLAELSKKLQRTIRETLVEMKAEINSRLAFGIGCVPMILIGIALGVVKKGGHVLSAFGASCVPAAVLIVCIISGRHVTDNLESVAVSGILIIWAGVVVLTGLTIAMYIRLQRN